MRNAAALVCFLILVLGFGDADTLRPRPVKAFAPRASAAPPPQATVPLGFQAISVGEVVTGTLTEDTISGGIRIPGVPQLFYQLTAPADGTLIVTLDWDPSLGPLALIGQSAFVYFRLGSNCRHIVGSCRPDVLVTGGSRWLLLRIPGPRAVRADDLPGELQVSSPSTRLGVRQWRRRLGAS
jgi:hypothetical protein